MAERGQRALLFPAALPQLCSHPFFCSFERLLLHAVCQYLDLISASECLLPGKRSQGGVVKAWSRGSIPALQKETEAPRTQAFVLRFLVYPMLPPNSEPRLPQVPYLVLPCLPTWLCLLLRAAAAMVSTATLELDPSGFPLWEGVAASTAASSHRLRGGGAWCEGDFSVEVGMPLDRAQLQLMATTQHPSHPLSFVYGDRVSGVAQASLLWPSSSSPHVICPPQVLTWRAGDR